LGIKQKVYAEESTIAENEKSYSRGT